MNRECHKTCYKADEETFSLVSWQRYIQSAQNNLQSAQKERQML